MGAGPDRDSIYAFVFVANEVSAKLVWCRGADIQQVLLDPALLSSELASYRYSGPIVADPGAAAPITRKGGGARGLSGTRLLAIIAPCLCPPLWDGARRAAMAPH